MRVKTEEKRQKIIEIASSLFLESGFEGISMSEISARVGGSKATLYNYFSSKEEIFLAVMMTNAQKLAAKAYSVLDDAIDLKEKLNRFGYEYLCFILSQEMIDMKRTVIAQADKLDIGSHVYECGFKMAWGRVATTIENGMKAKLVKKSDPWMAAMQLKALLEADIYTKRLLNVDKRLNKKTLPTAVENALKVFWAYYSPK